MHLKTKPIKSNNVVEESIIIIAIIILLSLNKFKWRLISRWRGIAPSRFPESSSLWHSVYKWSIPVSRPCNS